MSTNKLAKNAGKRGNKRRKKVSNHSIRNISRDADTRTPDFVYFLRKVTFSWQGHCRSAPMDGTKGRSYFMLDLDDIGLLTSDPGSGRRLLSRIYVVYAWSLFQRRIVFSYYGFMLLTGEGMHIEYHG